MLLKDCIAKRLSNANKTYQLLQHTKATVIRQGNSAFFRSFSMYKTDFSISERSNSMSKSHFSTSKRRNSMSRTHFSMSKRGTSTSKTHFSISTRHNSISKSHFSMSKRSYSISKTHFSTSKRVYVTSKTRCSTSKRGNSIYRKTSGISERGKNYFGQDCRELTIDNELFCVLQSTLPLHTNRITTLRPKVMGIHGLRDLFTTSCFASPIVTDAGYQCFKTKCCFSLKSSLKKSNPILKRSTLSFTASSATIASQLFVCALE